MNEIAATAWLSVLEVVQGPGVSILGDRAVAAQVQFMAMAKSPEEYLRTAILVCNTHGLFVTGSDTPKPVSDRVQNGHADDWLCEEVDTIFRDGVARFGTFHKFASVENAVDLRAMKGEDLVWLSRALVCQANPTPSQQSSRNRPVDFEIYGFAVANCDAEFRREVSSHLADLSLKVVSYTDPAPFIIWCFRRTYQEKVYRAAQDTLLDRTPRIVFPDD